MSNRELCGHYPVACQCDMGVMPLRPGPVQNGWTAELDNDIKVVEALRAERDGWQHDAEAHNHEVNHLTVKVQGLEAETAALRERVEALTRERDEAVEVARVERSLRELNARNARPDLDGAFLHGYASALQRAHVIIADWARANPATRAGMEKDNG